ncbi:MAG: LytR/AlgR family response regulator transcription factor [Hominenteromicrobium sp.]|uniref:LytR/AlgR family response regulator transcription factor n=2 Tax=Oscillospiraceae TaxID=216572 RepID=UPI0027E47CA4|nr:response regulator [Hominenteromicrobium mulieris]
MTILSLVFKELIYSGITPDIAFLDVEMPGRSGIHVGAELMQKNVYVKIIIITSFPDYLDEAMDFHVYRYLSKPIDENRFCRSLSAALKQLHMETVYIHVCTVDGGLKLRADEIICVERRKNKGSFAKKTEAFTRFMKMRKENFM